MARMTEHRIREFLLERARTAKLATTRADGRPHVAPIWFDLDDDGTIVFMTGATSVKGRSILRDPRVSFCVDDDTPPFAFVIVDGTAAPIDDDVELLRWATRIGGRYMGADVADQYGRRNAVAGELLIRIIPSHIVAMDGVAD